MSTISNASPKIQGSQETIFIDQSTPNKVIATAQKIKAISSEIIGLIRLEDGSLWDLRFLSEPNTEIFSNWDLEDLIVIFPNPNENFFFTYNYILYNSAKKTSILANLYFGPEIGGAFTKKATEIDLVTGNITLSDGSSWLIADHFKETLKKWKIDDCIILGSGNKGNNILINVNLNSFVESK